MPAQDLFSVAREPVRYWCAEAAFGAFVIAARLLPVRIPIAQGGRSWYPATVRYRLNRELTAWACRELRELRRATSVRGACVETGSHRFLTACRRTRQVRLVLRRGRLRAHMRTLCAHWWGAAKAGGDRDAGLACAHLRPMNSAHMNTHQTSAKYPDWTLPPGNPHSVAESEPDSPHPAPARLKEPGAPALTALVSAEGSSRGARARSRSTHAAVPA
jgi:hypothetical protein